jgi:hypothetical protein
LTPTVSLGPVTPAGNPGDNTIDAAMAAVSCFGSGGADNFVFANVDMLCRALLRRSRMSRTIIMPRATGSISSALTSQFHAPALDDAMNRARGRGRQRQVCATLQVNLTDPSAPPSGPNWVSIAQIDGAHAGDPDQCDGRQPLGRSSRADPRRLAGLESQAASAG